VAQLRPIDPTRPPSAFKRAMTAIALSKPGTWFYVNVASRIDPWLMRISRGRINSTFRVVPVVLLVTRGAKSGLERTVPLVYFTEGEDVILMASSFGRPRYPAWYHNLKANPGCHLRQGGGLLPYRASEVEGPDRDRLYAEAKQLYSGYGVYEDRVSGIRRVPVLRLTPA
jgi:deazaflavin-dependent oxidoreductase (nitroreductase family)